VVYDAMASLALIDELREAYSRGATVVASSSASTSALGYEQFVALERSRLGNGARESMLEAWRRELDGRPLRLDLGHAPRPEASDWHMAGPTFRLRHEVLSGLEGRAKAAGATLFAALFAGWMETLRAETGQTDLIAGTSVSLRESNDLQRVVGPMVNIVPVRVVLDQRGMTTALPRTASALAMALERRWLPIGDLIENLAPADELVAAPRFGLNHNFHFYDAQAFRRAVPLAAKMDTGESEFAPGVQGEEATLPKKPRMRPYELTCRVWRAASSLRIGVRANVRSPGLEFANRVGERYRELLQRFAEGERPSLRATSGTTGELGHKSDRVA